MAARILLGGVGKSDVASKIREIGEEGLDVTITNDMDAAMKLRAGQADYFFGTCHTGHLDTGGRTRPGGGLMSAARRR